jgi:pimeloyl-ACP methyl ester carboxylesterase
MEKHLINIDGQNVFFLAKGNGHPIILFHASPSSSKMFVPLIEKLSHHFLVIAPDTPAYGQSQPLNFIYNDLKELAVFVNQFTEKLGLDKFSIYGSATGAQLGIRYTLEFPDKVEHLFLDNAAHFTDKQRDDIFTSYFPDLTPQKNGIHLERTWKIVSNMFKYFPWYKKSEEYKLDRQVPPTIVLHHIVKDFLSASKNYSLAYKFAFHHERGEYVQNLKIPTTLFNWQGSIVKSYIDQLLEFEFPKNIKVTETPIDNNGRNEFMINLMCQTISKEENNFDFSNYILKKEEPLDFSNYPKITPDPEGKYLQKAWAHILYKNPNLDLEEAHQKLYYWMNSI